MKLKFKRSSPKVMIPTYGTLGSAAIDLTAFEKKDTPNYIEYDTGLSVEIPEGYVGLVFPRSSISEKSLALTNSVGVIDSDYRGTIKFRFRSTAETPFFYRDYKLGDRIGQLMIVPIPKIQLEEVSELSSTQRGAAGFGSTNP